MAWYLEIPKQLYEQQARCQLWVCGHHPSSFAPIFEEHPHEIAFEFVFSLVLMSFKEHFQWHSAGHFTNLYLYRFIS
jgi:hypothetical protein